MDYCDMQAQPQYDLCGIVPSLCSSSIVQRALMDAHEAGTDFRVIVVDSRPKMEGEQLHS